MWFGLVIISPISQSKGLNLTCFFISAVALLRGGVNVTIFESAVSEICVYRFCGY